MEVQFFPIAVLPVAVALLVRAELGKNVKQIMVLKPVSTVLCITAALLSMGQPQTSAPYLAGILVGLLLSLVGDVALIFPDNPSAFAWGLRSFLAAHVAYLTAFWLNSGLHKQDWVTGAALLTVAALVYLRLRPNLGRMKIPVFVYLLVISLMVLRAASTLFGGSFSHRQAWMICVGALLFYVSDLMLAWNRYGKPFRYNRISLLFYYAGQALFALSVSAA